MSHRIKVIDIELDSSPAPIAGLTGYRAVRAMVRLHGVPIGRIDLAVTGDELSAEDVREGIVEQLARPIANHLLSDLLHSPAPVGGWRLDDLVHASHPQRVGGLPLVSVAVCTRDRSIPLSGCLDALMQLDYPNLEVLVVDNASSTNATEVLVRTGYPDVRYVHEPHPGLDWARNRAVVEARGEILAFTDDDVEVDSQWISALVSALSEQRVMAVTGLVIPYELETEAENLFEQYGGFGRGFKRFWSSGRTGASRHLGTGKFGTGANMAFRRTVFGEIGFFDPALDVGTLTNGGGDLEMFFRVLKAGHTLAYEPGAMVRHHHRRDYAQLRTQLTNNGVGFYSYLVRTAIAYPDERLACIRFGAWWLWWWNVRRLLISFVRSGHFPRDLIVAELRGSITGLFRYPRAKRIAAGIARDHGASQFETPSRARRQHHLFQGRCSSAGSCAIDLGVPLREIESGAQHAELRIAVTRAGQSLGDVTIASDCQPASSVQLREAIARQLGLGLLAEDGAALDESSRSWAIATSALRDRFVPSEIRQSSLPASVPVSVVVATWDRPEALRACLSSLIAQQTRRSVEIVVVDNHPESGLTSPVVRDFRGVVLVSETRAGLSYARNAGIAASTGQIVIATDDDVVAPLEWIETLIAPFKRDDVMVATGNVLPLAQETEAQRVFERYGGLGRGTRRLVADKAWFDGFKRRAVPTWKLGATANAAFRASIFNHPKIGLLDEALGAGTPTGCSEDTDLFYRVLKAGFTIVYEPRAYVWHNHRSDMDSLRRQIYNYSKGHVAYHLTTLMRDRDLRVLPHLLVRLPVWRVRQLAAQARHRRNDGDAYPLSPVLMEIAGNLAGPLALWRSRRRVAQNGRSDRYVPPDQRGGSSVEDLDPAPRLAEKDTP